MPAAPASNVAEFEHARTSSEAIADQAVSIISRASAHVSENLDELQKRLDQLRAVQHKKLIGAEDAIRDLMDWSQYVSECSGLIDAEITKIRGDVARPV